jgi:hypothetical protein
MLASSALAQNANSISAGAILNPIASGFTVEYERLLGKSVTIGVRYAAFNYEYTDDAYVEEGNNKGFDVTGRYYFAGEGIKGLYIGAALGSYKSDWDWREGNARGSGSTKSIHYGAMVGYKHHFTNNFFIDGYLGLGTWAGSGKDNTGTKESEVGAYGALGASLGFQF